MKLQIIPKILFSTFLFGFITFLQVDAKVAKPGMIEAAQPDGTTVTLQLYGNFHSRMAFSEDGYPLIADDENFYNYAVCGSDGNPVSSGVRANSIKNRSGVERSFLKSIDKEAVVNAFNKKYEPKPSTRTIGLVNTAFPVMGEQKSIAILVEFQNKEFTLENPYDYFNRLLNEEGFDDYGATGSAKDYFVSNSYGKFKPDFDLYGPVTLEHAMSYYGSRDDRYAYQMVIEACRQLDDEIDFTQYDRDGDGVIDNIYIFYAGYGEADGGGPETIWPHSWDIDEAARGEKFYFDGVRVNHYACSNELQYSDDSPDGIGSFCHEFSHVMGLPDLYSTVGSMAPTPGDWSILDIGSYNNNSRTPPNYSSFEKYSLDWIEPVLLNKPGQYTLEHFQESMTAYLVATEKENEFFLLENRQKKGFDTYLPGHGMLVWHIDFVQDRWDTNMVNTDAKHLFVDLVEADNESKPSSYAADPFPGKNNITEFTCQTTPAFVSWSETPVAVEIIDIKESSEGIITFTAVGCDESGIDDILSENEAEPFILKGNLVVAISGQAQVYDLTGRKIADALPGVPVTLSKGFYIVSDGKTNKKFAVN